MSEKRAIDREVAVADKIRVYLRGLSPHIKSRMSGQLLEDALEALDLKDQEYKEDKVKLQNVILEMEAKIAMLKGALEKITKHNESIEYFGYEFEIAKETLAKLRGEE